MTAALADSSKSAVFYDKLERWGAPMSEADRHRIERTLALVPPDTRTVLDVGCGDGAVTRSLTERGVTVIGVDFSRAALNHFTGLKTIGVIEALPFADHAFDLVLCAEVLEHLPADIYDAARLELQRVASHWLIISTPNAEYLPAGLGTCPECHTKYHVNRHVRTFDVAIHQGLFDQFVWETTTPIHEWSHDPLMIGIQQRWFNLYAYRANLVCPCCGHHGVAQKRASIFSRAVLKALWLIRQLWPKRRKPRWIASRFSRQPSPSG